MTSSRCLNCAILFFRKNGRHKSYKHVLIVSRQSYRMASFGNNVKQEIQKPRGEVNSIPGNGGRSTLNVLHEQKLASTQKQGAASPRHSESRKIYLDKDGSLSFSLAWPVKKNTNSLRRACFVSDFSPSLFAIWAGVFQKLNWTQPPHPSIEKMPTLFLRIDSNKTTWISYRFQAPKRSKQRRVSGSARERFIQPNTQKTPPRGLPS